jgi:acyl carrier protein
MFKGLTEAEILERLRDILAEEFEIPPESIESESGLYDDLGIDSIDAVDLIVRLRELTGKKVPPEQFREVRTVGDVVRVVKLLDT